eukprot:365181-Chlamydomonas_euryale.AAC.8
MTGLARTATTTTTTTTTDTSLHKPSIHTPTRTSGFVFTRSLMTARYIARNSFLDSSPLLSASACAHRPHPHRQRTEREWKGHERARKGERREVRGQGKGRKGA